MEKVLLVEDDPFTRKMMSMMLNSLGYSVDTASNGKEALEIIKTNGAEIILMDIDMPIMNGIEATKAIKNMEIESVVIMLTAHGDEKMMKEAAEAGADDFLMKPIELNTLKSHLELVSRAMVFHRTKRMLTENNKKLLDLDQTKLNALIEENFELASELLKKLSIVAEFRDDETYEHTQRVKANVLTIAEWLSKDTEYIYLITEASPFHDIGKIGIPDSILLKPGKLNQDEFAIMMNHTVIGKKILEGSKTRILQKAEIIAYTHHERWDGKGYPRGLKEEEIPLEGRIVCVADSIDAMFSKRPYKEKFSESKVKEELIKNKGLQFDPQIVDAIIEHWDYFIQTYSDKNQDNN
ncbi:MAG: response regulator [Candidatus Rehaiarchaeum fermentans]|nr:response regulator [Candidatus Rehaiarchaeum fermentans]